MMKVTKVAQWGEGSWGVPTHTIGSDPTTIEALEKGIGLAAARIEVIG
jgi:hypothetical protein